MANYSIPNIPVLATQLNDTDLFEKADGPASGQSQRVTALVMKGYFGGNSFTSSLIVTDNSSTFYSVAHGLGVTPGFFDCFAVCVANDASSGYTAGDVIHFNSFHGVIGQTAASAISASPTLITLSLIQTLVGNEVNWSITFKNGGGSGNPGSWSNFKILFLAKT